MAFVPIVVAVCALVSIIRYHTVQQSSWRGGSYGMFATYEAAQARTVIALVADGEPMLIPIPDDLRTLADRAEVVPGGHAPVELADALAERTDAPVRVEVRGHDVRGDTSEGLRIGIKILRVVQSR